MHGEQISALQILNGVVTVEELKEIGVRENVLNAIRREIDEFQAREKAAEQAKVFVCKIKASSIFVDYMREN